MNKISKILVICLLAGAAVAPRALEIVIPEGWDSPTRIAVVPFGGPPLRESRRASESIQLADIVAFDLLRSGQFSSLPNENMLSYPTKPDEVLFRDWRILKMDYLVIGRASLEGSGKVAVAYHLFDVNLEREIAAERLTVPAAQIREVGHRISDTVYEEVTGIRGAFSTKILYVLVENPATDSSIYRLVMADSDGEREQVLFQSGDSIMSPSWAPDGKRVAYVSFETGRSTIIVQNLKTGQRTSVANYRGINGAPVFSPDGSKLAMSLSRDGNSEIYIKDLASGELQRVTRRASAIDTEPSWGADGNSLIFTSDRGGRPQIYRKDLVTSLVDRLTFIGDYNARARLLPSGRHLIYVHGTDGVYHIAWQDIERDVVRILTKTSLDESPSLAPNGTMMIYATQDRGRGILAVVSVDSRVKYILPSSVGDVQEPAWSPFLTTGIR